jgi:hypothetical protein
MGDPTLQTVQPVQAGDTTQPQNISLDAKIDNFLIQYERESLPQQQTPPPGPAPMPEGRQFHHSTFKLLFEADDDKPDDLGGDMGESDDSSGGDPFGGGGDDSGGDDPLGGGSDDDSSSGDGQSPMEAPVPRINIRILAPKIARLVNNYEQLVDPRTVILNRVQAYMQKNYDENVAKELMTTLELNFQLKAREANLGQSSYPGQGAGVGDLSSTASSGGSLSSSSS